MLCMFKVLWKDFVVKLTTPKSITTKTLKNKLEKLRGTHEQIIQRER